MKFCTGLPIAMFIREARQGNPRPIEQVARGVEELGFWGITVPDHILDPDIGITGHEYAEVARWRYADPLTMLSYLAAVTTHVRLIPRVLVIPYRTPFAVAHALATIDSLSGGRLVFAPGVGAIATEFTAMGIPRHQRGRITDEYLEIIFRLWERDNVSFAGRYHRFENVSLLVRPVQQPRPPVWVGGSSRAALARAVRLGDGWTPSAYPYPTGAAGGRSSVSTTELREEVAWAAAQCRELGRPPLEMVISSSPPLRFLDRSTRSSRRHRPVIDYFTCEGTPEELLEEFLAYLDAGATSFVVNFPGNTPEEFLRSARGFAREIMPALEAEARNRRPPAVSPGG